MTPRRRDVRNNTSQPGFPPTAEHPAFLTVVIQSIGIPRLGICLGFRRVATRSRDGLHLAFSRTSECAPEPGSLLADHRIQRSFAVEPQEPSLFLMILGQHPLASSRGAVDLRPATNGTHWPKEVDCRGV